MKYIINALFFSLFVIAVFPTYAVDEIIWEEQCNVYSEKNTIECQVWFNSKDQISSVEIDIQSNNEDQSFISVTSDIELYQVNDRRMAESWIIEKGDISGDDLENFNQVVSQLVNANAGINKLSIFEASNKSTPKIVGLGITPTKEKITKEIQKIKSLKKPSAIDQNLAQAINIIKSSGKNSRKTIFWVIGRKSINSKDITAKIAKVFSRNENIRLIIVPVEIEEMSFSEVDFDPLFELIPGMALSTVNSETVTSSQQQIESYMYNGGQLSVNYEVACGETELTFKTNNQQSSVQLALPQCAAPKTACELDSTSNSCLAEQFKSCEINPSQGNCPSVVLSFCNLNPGAMGCDAKLLDFCKMNPNDNNYNCEERLEEYCQSNPSDDNYNCNKVLAEQCKASPEQDNCPQVLFLYCDFNLSSPGCDDYVVNYCQSKPGIRGCGQVLNNSCWVNKDTPECQSRLFESCLANPATHGCNDILLSQCQLNSTNPICIHVLMTHCEINPDADGCTDRLTQRCLNNDKLPGCTNLLTNFCWNDANADSSCYDRLSTECLANPEKAGCASYLLDACGLDDVTNPSCSTWVPEHCETFSSHGTCIAETKKQRMMIIGGVSAIILIVFFFVIRKKLKKLPSNAGEIYLFESREEDVIEHPITLKKSLIGRGDNADVQANEDDATLSTIHAQLEYTPEGFVIADLQSTNGVYVNNHKIEESIIKGGDIVRLGNTTFRFEVR